MYLAELNIENFRGIRNTRLVLKPRTLLIGPNNVGKTTILEAIALLLGRDRMIFELSEWDFFNRRMFLEEGDHCDGQGGAEDADDKDMGGAATGQQQARPRNSGGDTLSPLRISISGVLAGLSKEEQRVFCNPSVSGSLGVWNPVDGEFIDDRQARTHEEPAVRLNFVARFDSNEGEIVWRRFFPMDGEDPFEGDPTWRVQRKHVQMAGYYLLSSSRLWKDAARFTSSIFSRLLQQQRVHPGEVVRQIANAIERLKPKAQDARELKDLLKGFRETINRFIPISSMDPLGFEVTDLSSHDIERTLTLFLRGARDERRFPMSKHGSAALSVQILAMLVMFGQFRRLNGQSFLLGLEEPELHLHPHAQRNLISVVRGETSQILTTTHSPAITECFQPNEICVLSTEKATLTGRYLLSHEVTLETKNRIKRWVFARRRLFAEALMSLAILVVEGETEAHMLAPLSTLQTDGGLSLDQLGCTVMPGDGASLPDTLPMAEGFQGIRIVLVDGDQAGDKCVKKIRELPPQHRPHLLFRLPVGEAFERSLAHGLEIGQARDVLRRLDELGCTEYSRSGENDPRANLAHFLKSSNLKKDASLRVAVIGAFGEADVLPPIVAEIRREIATAISSPPSGMAEKRLGAVESASEA